MKNNNKKKIAVITLFSALVLGGAGVTAWMVTKSSNNQATPAHISTTDKTKASNVELVETGSFDSENKNSEKNKDKKDDKDKKDEKDKDKDKKDDKDKKSDKDKKDKLTQSSSLHTDNKEGTTSIFDSKIANSKEAGSVSIASVAQVKDIINRSSANRANPTGTNSIKAPTKTSTAQEEEARRLAELEAKRTQKPKEDTTNTVKPVIPTNPLTPITPLVPTIVPPIVTPTPTNPAPAPTPSTPAVPEKPAETEKPSVPSVPETPTVPETPSTPTVPDDKPVETEKPKGDVTVTVTPSVPEKPSAPDTKPVSPAEKPSEEDKKPSATDTDKNKPTETVKDKDGQNVVVTIKTQADLEAYLKKTGRDLTGDKVTFALTEDVKIPKESYKIVGGETFFNFPANPEGHTLDFQGSSFLIGKGSAFYWDVTGNHAKDGDSLKVKNATIYGSISETTSDNGKVGGLITDGGNKYSDGRFSARLVHASNITFEDLTFNNAHASGCHLFDVVGSDHITINKVVAAGYGGKDLSDEEVQKRFNHDPHSVYSEAIQIDSAIPGAIGSLDYYENTILATEANDGVASHDITISNSTFTSYVGLTGQDIADGNTAMPVVRNYGPTIGAHTSGKDPYKNITISNNKFENTIGFKASGDSATTDRLLYPIHIYNASQEKDSVKVSGNTFNDKVKEQGNSGVEVNGVTAWTRSSSKTDTPKEEKPTTPAETPKLTNPAESKPISKEETKPSTPTTAPKADAKPVTTAPKTETSPTAAPKTDGTSNGAVTPKAK